MSPKISILSKKKARLNEAPGGGNKKNAPVKMADTSREKRTSFSGSDILNILRSFKEKTKNTAINVKIMALLKP